MCASIQSWKWKNLKASIFFILSVLVHVGGYETQNYQSEHFHVGVKMKT